MKKYVFVVLALTTGVYLSACGKKQQAVEEMQEPLSTEALSVLSTTNVTTPEVKASVSTTQAKISEGTTTSVVPQLEPLPPAGPYKPTVQEIQTALKNAGYYNGTVDGKLGPLSKKAIEEFQKANNLQVDGKFGPKTWAVLSKYLTLSPADAPEAKTQTKKKR